VHVVARRIVLFLIHRIDDLSPGDANVQLPSFPAPRTTKILDSIFLPIPLLCSFQSILSLIQLPSSRRGSRVPRVTMLAYIGEMESYQQFTR